MVDLREPLDSLIHQPQSFTSHLQFPDPAGIVLYDDTLSGTQRFVFGKHSGTAAVEAVLAKHTDLLAAHGISFDQTLVERVLERVKELRELRIAANYHTRAVEEFYRKYHDLGISEAALVELALETRAMAARNSVEA